MKAITKLLFVALLIGVALSLPTKVRASGGNYICDNPNYPECYNPLAGWMQQCMDDCAEDGSGQENPYCYSVTYTDCNFNSQGQLHSVAATNIGCCPLPSSGFTCAQQCVVEYNTQYNACLSEWCTQE